MIPSSLYKNLIYTLHSLRRYSHKYGTYSFCLFQNSVYRLAFNLIIMNKRTTSYTYLKVCGTLCPTDYYINSVMTVNNNKQTI